MHMYVCEFMYTNMYTCIEIKIYLYLEAFFNCKKSRMSNITISSQFSANAISWSKARTRRYLRSS